MGKREGEKHIQQKNVITVAAAQFLSEPPELYQRAGQINTVCIDSHVSLVNIIPA